MLRITFHRSHDLTAAVETLNNAPNERKADSNPVPKTE
jgi:hypothetical protein